MTRWSTLAVCGVVAKTRRAFRWDFRSNGSKRLTQFAAKRRPSVAAPLNPRVTQSLGGTRSPPPTGPRTKGTSCPEAAEG